MDSHIFMTSAYWVLRNKCGVRHMVHCLDDFLFINRTKKQCLQYLLDFQNLADYIGLLLAPEKTDGPGQEITFLGIRLSTPRDKLELYAEEIRQFLKKSQCTLKQMQAILG